MSVRNLYQRYRAWARRSDDSSLIVLRVVLGLAGAVTYLLLRISDSMWALPWLVAALGFIASLDALGAAWDRGAKVEAMVRFLIVDAIFLAGAFWVYSRLPAS